MMRSAKHLWLLVLVVGLGAVLLWPELADARVGGGQSYNRSPGGGGGGGGGGGEVDLILLLLHLCIRYPVLGIPVTLAVVMFFMSRAIWNRAGGDPQVHRTHGTLDDRVSRRLDGIEAKQDRRLARAQPVPGLDRLREQDPSFSTPTLLDYVVLVHRRTYEALTNRSWAALMPFVAPSAQETLLGELKGVQAVQEIVVGGARVMKVERRGDYDHLYVDFESTRLETLADGRDLRVLVREHWTFRRLATAQSPTPQAAERLGCPSCGAAVEVTRMGTCSNCDTPITAGQLQWQAIHIAVFGRNKAQVPDLRASPGGVEASVHLPTLSAPDLDSAMRTLRGRHPEFDGAAFGNRVDHVYRSLQAAWSNTEWEAARPYVTDRMFQTLRFWIERYRRARLRNQLDDVQLERVRIVKIESDRFYLSITVRLWGSIRDYVVNAHGDVVGGNRHEPRRFSEYWTLLRAADASADTREQQPGCPSCGAPLDNVSQAGICGYCDSKITTGRFDWVLARIEQPEAYRG